MTTQVATRRRLAVGLAAVAIGAIAPSAAEASVPPIDDGAAVVTVVDEGDPANQVLLGGPPVPGTVADSTTNYDVDMSVLGQGFPIALDVAAAADMARTTEVLEVGTDGSFTARETFTSFNLATASAEGGDAEDMGLDGAGTTDFGPIVDVPLIVEYGATGEPVSAEVEAATATPEQDELADSLVENGFGTEAFIAGLPSVPVGEGAVWTVAESDSSASLVVPLMLRFTLVSLEGDDYTIEIGLEGDVLDALEADSEDAEVTGDVTLTGTLTGNAANRLDVQLTMDMLMDVSDLRGRRDARPRRRDQHRPHLDTPLTPDNSIGVFAVVGVSAADTPLTKHSDDGHAGADAGAAVRRR